MESFATTILPFILSVLSVILSVVMHLLDEKYAYICLVVFILTVIASSTIFYIEIADLFCNSWRTAAVIIQGCVCAILGFLPALLGLTECVPYDKGVDIDVTTPVFAILVFNMMALLLVSSIYNP